MQPVQVSHIAKSFGSTEAVTDVSFDVEQGEIFGLLGPNGAGKTTTIRLMLDVFKPDSGSISILGGPMTEEKKDHIGYMPEERGLYQDVSLEQCLVYLATLKGVPAAEAHRRVGSYLERFELAAHRNKKVKELSKGMQQKAQVICTIAHRPELIIVDEPFASLDPVNTEMVKDLLQELRAGGATIVLCTHQMHHAEELCNYIVLIDHGRVVLRGSLEDIRHRYAGNAVIVRATGELPTVLGVETTTKHNDAMRWNLSPGTTPQDVLKALVAQDVVLERFELALPSLEEIFVRVVREGGA